MKMALHSIAGCAALSVAVLQFTIAAPAPAPTDSRQPVTTGRNIYVQHCAACHGLTGAGNGHAAVWLYPKPRDFSAGLFRGGHTGRDLYLRIHNGMPGTPMIPYGADLMNPEERWALVHYIQSLRRTDVAVNDLLTPEDGSIPVRRVKKLPTDPMEAFWDSLDPVRVPFNPLWPEPNQVYAVAVSAVTDGKKIAVLLQWRDEWPQHNAIRVQDFQDGAALQFSLSGNFGFLGMRDGASTNPA